MAEYFVGLMSGTSMDGIDAVVTSFGSSDVDIVASHSQAYPPTLKRDLLAAIREPMDVALDTDGELHREVGQCFRDAAISVIEMSGVPKEQIRAIGSHGQTLRHQPNIDKPFSLQVGDADIIAAGTGIETVANFREADILAGGQGAPLVPPFHQWLFQSATTASVVVNIGGISNITALPANGSPAIGFDTGPGNGLMDVWTRTHRCTDFDSDGKWAASGNVIGELLKAALDDPYFQLEPPKSTGFEYFNKDWLHRLDVDRFDPADVQATLCELTAQTIANAIDQHAPATSQTFVCGGGVHNAELMRRLDAKLVSSSLSSTSHAGLDPEWVEAVAFAWLAMRTVNHQTGNLPSVTGATHEVVLGDIHLP